MTGGLGSMVCVCSMFLCMQSLAGMIGERITCGPAPTHPGLAPLCTTYCCDCAPRPAPCRSAIADMAGFCAANRELSAVSVWGLHAWVGCVLPVLDVGALGHTQCRAQCCWARAAAWPLRPAPDCAFRAAR